MPIFKFVKEGLGSSEPPCECIRTWVQHASEAYTEMWVCITAPHSSISSGRVKYAARSEVLKGSQRK